MYYQRQINLQLGHRTNQSLNQFLDLGRSSNNKQTFESEFVFHNLRVEIEFDECNIESQAR